MFIELGNIFENEGSSVSFDHTVKMDGSDYSADSCFVSGIRCRGSIFNRAGVVQMVGQADFDYQAPCDRCTAMSEKHFSVPIEHELVRRRDTDGHDDDYILVEGSGLELDDIIYEDAVFSLPMRYLCKETCKGLCPVCGADLNVGECGCKKPSDPRLEALRQLLDK